MSTARPQVLFAFGQQIRDSFLDPAALGSVDISAQPDESRSEMNKAEIARS